jgi:hypothetical protein
MHERDKKIETKMNIPQLIKATTTNKKNMLLKFLCRFSARGSQLGHKINQVYFALEQN